MFQQAHMAISFTNSWYYFQLLLVNKHICIKETNLIVCNYFKDNILKSETIALCVLNITYIYKLVLGIGLR